MIEGGIKNGECETTINKTLEDLKSFQSFLYRNLKNNTNGPFFYDKSPTIL